MPRRPTKEGEFLLGEVGHQEIDQEDQEGTQEGGGEITADTKFYVALEIKNSGDGSDDLVESEVRGGLVKKLGKLDGFVVAPSDEKLSDAKKLLKKHKEVDGFYLMAKAKLTYSGGTMKVKVSVSVFTYPNKALKGSYSVTVGFPDVEEDDKSAQKELLGEAGRSAAEKFADNADRFK